MRIDDKTLQHWTFEMTELSMNRYQVIAQHKSGTTLSKQGQQAQLLMAEIKQMAVAYEFMN